MGISGINDHGSLIQGYQVPALPKPHLGALQDTGLEKESAAAVPALDIHEETSAVVLPGRGAQLEDISITFNKQEAFGYLGQDSDIHSLDVERAISDMKKDQVLQQYQYFVGSVRNLPAEEEDGAVLAK